MAGGALRHFQPGSPLFLVARAQVVEKNMLLSQGTPNSSGTEAHRTDRRAEWHMSWSFKTQAYFTSKIQDAFQPNRDTVEMGND